MSFTHIKNKKNINMVDISNKEISHREASARALIKFTKKTFGKIIIDNSPKGEIFNTARLAAVMAAKKTSELIPLCHNINLNSVEVEFKIRKKEYMVEVTILVKSNSSTGVEMEALTSCSLACLTIYDMCKSFDKKIIIEDIRLISKSGGKSGDYIDDNI
tara:strand:+ start:299 stop:778 length:480 start_codon:yes stop_codon:yes gene_type:complete